MPVTALSAEEAVRLADLNLAAYLRHAASFATGGAVNDEDGILLVAGSHPNPHPYVNCALRLDSNHSARDVLDRAGHFFGERGRGYALWIRDHADDDLEEAARSAGMWQRPPLEGQPALFIDHPLELSGLDLPVERVTDLQTAQEYLRVVGDAYDLAGSPPELVWSMFLRPEAVLAPEVVAFVAYVDDVPAAGCMTYVAHDVAGMYWAARNELASGRQLGAACAAACVRAGLELGAKVASGQGSARGTPLWLAAGFEVLTYHRRYISTPNVSDPS